jgi:hypothetical protein
MRYVQVFSAATLVLLALVTSGCGPSGGDAAPTSETQQVKGLATNPEAAQSDANASSTGVPPTGLPPTGEYRVEVFFGALAGRLKVLVNGFPVYESNRGQMGRTADSETERPINTALVGQDNELRVQVVPMLRRRGRHLQVAEQHLAWQVRERWGGAPVRVPASAVNSAYGAWQASLDPVWTSVLRAEAAGRLGTASAIEAMRDSVAARPFELAATFDNERGPDFSYLFEEAPVITDTTRLVDYALKLRDWMAAKDTSRLWEEFRPSFQDGVLVDGYDDSKERRHMYLSLNRQNLVLDDAESALAFSRDEVRVRKWVQGRVWELHRTRGRRLLRNMPVYVAEVDGELKVVR